MRSIGDTIGQIHVLNTMTIRWCADVFLYSAWRLEKTKKVEDGLDRLGFFYLLESCMVRLSHHSTRSDETSKTLLVGKSVTRAYTSSAKKDQKKFTTNAKNIPEYIHLL